MSAASISLIFLQSANGAIVAFLTRSMMMTALNLLSAVMLLACMMQHTGMYNATMLQLDCINGHCLLACGLFISSSVKPVAYSIACDAPCDLGCVIWRLILLRFGGTGSLGDGIFCSSRTGLQLRVLRSAFGVCKFADTDAGQEWPGWCWPPEGIYCVRTCSYAQLPA